MTRPIHLKTTSSEVACGATMRHWRDNPDGWDSSQTHPSIDHVTCDACRRAAGVHRCTWCNATVPPNQLVCDRCRAFDQAELTDFLVRRGAEREQQRARLAARLDAANRTIASYTRIVAALGALEQDDATAYELVQMTGRLDRAHADLDDWIERALEAGFDYADFDNEAAPEVEPEPAPVRDRVRERELAEEAVYEKALELGVSEAGASALAGSLYRAAEQVGQ